MKKLGILFLTVIVLGISGCKPDLTVRNVNVDFSGKFVEVEVANVGNKDAGEHMTYIEISQIGLTQESQYRTQIPGIQRGSSWLSGQIPFTSFSIRTGSPIELNLLTQANVVVRADAKNMVQESNEGNNLYDQNH